jgi:energy-coupling factor transporter ATP-binding protein EcfA2
MNLVKVEVKNCNNFDTAKITLAENKLNIKFAPNGTGKSTIAKALTIGLGGDKHLLRELLPFKLRKENPNNYFPEVVTSKIFNKVMCFNDLYVNQFVFKPNELLDNSFDIFIRTEEYTKREDDIEKLIGDVKQLFLNNPDLENLIANLKEMADAFKLSKTGLSKSSTGMKGLLGGNKIEHVPVGLEPYKPFIQAENSVGWIDWQTKGYEFSDLSDDCPFCTSHAADKKENIRKVGKEYDKNTIKNLIGIISVVNKLGDHFAENTKIKLLEITKLKNGIDKEHEAFLINVKTQVDNFTEKLENLKKLSTFQFKVGEKVAEKLPAYKLNLDFFSELNSITMQKAISTINASVDTVAQQAGLLQGKISQQQSEMKKSVERHQKCINEFLEFAGYRYAVEVVGEGESAQLKLKHIDHEEYLSGGNQHLSFGERNAFAIVLFMYECLSKKPDLIILDDPISSFDKNKKYAILEMLFRRDADVCLKGKTVMMLTHDVEPIIDTLRSLEKKFTNQTSSAFLTLISARISETIIEKNDIQTFSQICKSAIASGKNELIKLIYLRRHYEIADEKGDAYQIISNIFHKRIKPTDIREPREMDGNFPEIRQAQFESGCIEVAKHISGFSYTNLLEKVNDSNGLKLLYQNCSNGYEKLQVFRLLELDVDNSVVQKFINESYHIENEFICQLDPSKFDTVPEYVIKECNKRLMHV